MAIGENEVGPGTGLARGRREVRWEVFNVFNRVNLYLPVGKLSSPNFGRSLAAFPARQMQLGVKLVF